MYEDFTDWDIQELRRRVELIQDFDRTCDRLRDGFLYLLENYTPEEYTEVKRIPHRAIQPLGLDLLSL